MTPKAFLFRYNSTDQGTPGYLVCGSFRCFTLELPWRDNVRQKSCIPTGVYFCTWKNSKKFGLVPLLQTVQGRDGILIHSGTWAGNVDLGYKTNSHGCILLEKKLGKLDGQLAGFMSRIAMNELREHFKGRGFILEVQNANSNFGDLK
jgi:hypothetical protein